MLSFRRYAPTALDRQLRHALYSVLAIVVAMVFAFPLYWGLSTSLRTPLETFTIAGFGIPWTNFTPTLDNWIDQLQVPETQDALVNSTLTATFATLLALALGTPAAYALARFRFELVHNRDLAIFFSQRVLPPVATVTPFYLVVRTLGLLDTHFALLLVKELQVIGSNSATKRDLEVMMPLLAAGKLKPVVDRVFPLHAAADAHRYLEQGKQFGKVVLRVEHVE